VKTPLLATKAPRRGQGGQATTEFAVLALALVPIFILVPLIGKYIDMNQTAEQASRYLAFEASARNTRSTWKTDDELATEVRRRFFSNSDAPVKTGDAAGNFSAHRNPVWSDHTGKPLLQNFEDDVGVAGAKESYNAIASTALYRGELGLSDDNLYTGNVTVKIADVANLQTFDKIGLSTSRKTVLLADAWTARDNASIRGKIEDSFAMYPMGPLKGIIDIVGTLPTLVYDPALKVSDFDWDIVPCDRLVEGC
jgi:hypothetical protein